MLWCSTACNAVITLWVIAWRARTIFGYRMHCFWPAWHAVVSFRVISWWACTVFNQWFSWHLLTPYCEIVKTAIETLCWDYAFFAMNLLSDDVHQNVRWNSTRLWVTYWFFWYRVNGLACHYQTKSWAWSFPLLPIAQPVVPSPRWSLLLARPDEGIIVQFSGPSHQLRDRHLNVCWTDILATQCPQSVFNRHQTMENTTVASHLWARPRREPAYDGHNRIIRGTVGRVGQAGPAPV